MRRSMSNKLFFILGLYAFLLTGTTHSDPILSFRPTSLDVSIDEQKTVKVYLAPSNLTNPIVIEFLYDNETQPNQIYIDRLPDLTFNASASEEQSQTIIITGRHEGHVVLTARSAQINVSSSDTFVLIDVSRSKILTIFVQIVGWVYFAAWSISFYPQIILNFQRRSVIGLNFDFLSLNILGHSSYAVFNLVLYLSHDVQQQYYEKHPHGVLPVLLNDVIFSCHAVFACAVTVIQCFVFQRGEQRVSIVARLLGAIFLIFLFISTIVSLLDHLSTLSLIYFFSYVKLAITIIKYVPQAWMNYRRKSTEGWSIGNILLDFTGGILSILQMLFLAINYDDWSSIFGSPTKFGLGLFSVLFDILFIVQHYCLYRGEKAGVIPIHIQNHRYIDDFSFPESKA